jgi:hypothetical protein
MESLDWMFLKVSDLAGDDDADLLPKDKEPEAWSVTVDMKTLSRLNSKDIKRQDHIWGELILIDSAFSSNLKVKQMSVAPYVIIVIRSRSKIAELFTIH